MSSFWKARTKSHVLSVHTERLGTNMVVFLVWSSLFQTDVCAPKQINNGLEDVQRQKIRGCFG